ncbi:MAG: AtpZ/AtpI family protein [Acidimicrobiaceae bacterium]|nr:AtpZ/AtpI family protein [Acidimicrobiaceae bacterium]MYE75440.1 AtpZ/AtpI family protein [Acidimicrobiaceae bacterium]MYE96049.1 AtpZ/AtpI family protein [Acidimicrobiaceae bacterium]MYH42912.1 AtpZ/AtpI family protein [Acidimicrobiaceae bacterium]MYI55008.1 AtpZ/AtpI family protein [Acidimicrobiaceae bacterium]
MEHTEANSRAGAAEVRSGAGDALAKAFEMIATPAIFGFGGWLVDGRLGTFPLVTLVLAMIVLGYEVWSFVRHYGVSMDAALDSRRTSYGAPRPEASSQP